MTESQSMTPNSLLSDAAARDHGLTDEFWLDVYNRYQDEVANDPDVSFDSFERARTIRVPFQDGSVDVLIRFQPRPYEHWVMRFTAFPVAKGDEFREIPRSYWYDEPREVLGEAALLDASNRWQSHRSWTRGNPGEDTLREERWRDGPHNRYLQGLIELAMSDLDIACESLDWALPSGGRLIGVDSELKWRSY